MGLTVEVDPTLSSLLTAVGLLDADGHVVGDWFGQPLTAIRRCLSDPTQRAALFRLLDEALPSVAHPLAPQGAAWHPLLQPNDYGNVYLTVTGDLVGLALLVGTEPDQTPGVQVIATLALVDTAGGELRSVAAAPDHPLDIAVVATLGPGTGPDVVGLRVAVDVEGSVSVRVRLEDGAGAERTVAELDPTRIDGGMLDAAALLVRSVLAEIEDAADLDPDVAQVLRRVTTHLFGILGIGDASLPELPLAEAVSDPGALRSWLIGIIGDRTMLAAWFTHVAGLLGAAPLDQVMPTVAGDGSPDDPLRATLVELDADTALEIRLTVDGDLLTVGVGVSASAGRGRLAAGIGVLGVSLGGTAPVTVLPAADVLLSVPVSADGQDLGTVVAGATWDGTTVVPTLRLDDVLVGGTRHTLDLSSAQSVVDTGADLVAEAIGEALGDSGPGRHAMALLGLVQPQDAAGAPLVGWPRLSAADLLSGDILRAVAQLHRTVLDDPAQSWGALLGELAGLLGLPTDVEGDGTRATPWTVPLASDGALALHLLAWDERDEGTTAGTRLLRLGLRASAAEGIWRAGWTSELAGFDLPRDAAGTSRFLGSQRLGVSLTGLPLLGDPAGPWASADAVEVAMTWLPGTVPDLHVQVRGLVLGLGPDTLPPTDLTLPPRGGLDLTAPDLGLGIDAELVPTLVRMALSTALRTWGDDATAFAVGGLLGLHDELPGLASAWPRLLGDGADDLAAVLTDPLSAVQDLVRRVARGTAPDGSPLLGSAVGWLASLLSGTVPGDPSAVPPMSGAAPGSGTYDDPWSVPLVASGDGPALLLWLDGATTPAGAVAAGRALRATTGDALVDALALPSSPAVVADLLVGRRPPWLAAGLDGLAELLVAGDGLVPFDAAVALPGPGWARGTAVPCAHHRLPGHLATVAQIAQQRTAWGGGPIVLLSAATGGRHDWDAAVAAVDPGHDPDATIDLRSTTTGPAQHLAALDAVAVAYPADLRDDGTGDVTALADQIDAVMDRILALTGATRATLVGHGVAGIAARVSAERRPTMVRGVVTVGSPLAPTDTEAVATAVSDPMIADAVHLASALLAACPPTGADVAAGTPTLEAVDLLARILAGGPARDGVLPPAQAFTAAGLGRVPQDLGATVPGLAIGGRLPPGLIALVGSGVVPTAPAGGATHLGVGVALPVPLPAPSPGEVSVDLVLRADATRIALQDGAPEPARPAKRLTARAHLGRATGWLGGWLAGGDGTEASTRHVPRTRWADLGVTLELEQSGPAVRPFVVLHEAGAPGSRSTRIDLGTLAQTLPAHGARVRLPSGLDGAAVGVVVEALRAAGLVTEDNGVDAVDTAALAALLANPAATLGPRAGAVLDILAAAAGATRTATGAWLLALAPGIELEVAGPPWTMRLRTSASPAADGTPAATHLDGELTVSVPTFASTASVALVAGPARLEWRDAPRSLELALPPWLPTLSLLPGASASAAVTDAVLAALPRALLSGVLAPFLGEVLGNRLASVPLDELLTHPMRWVEPFDAPAVDALLAAVGAALGRPATGGLELPGGLRLRATGPAGGPVDLRLSGALAVTTGTSVGLDAGLRISLTGTSTTPDLTVGPLGGVSLDVVLPGTWGGLRIDVGASTAGLSLAVTPTGGQTPGARIDLLPTFSGLGALAAAGTRLLPSVLQQLVQELTPAGGPTGLLGAALQVAEAIGVYGPDAQGFTRTDRADRLAQMLDPAWWQDLVADPPAVANAIGGVLANLPLPIGDVVAAAGTVTWHVELTGLGTVDLALGWSAAGAPVLALTVGDVVLGPVRLDEATLGYDGDLACHLVLHLDAGGPLAPIQLCLAVDVTDLGLDGSGPSGPRFAVALLPLGPGTADQLELRLAPVPAVVDGGDAGLAILQAWGIPLALEVLLAAFGTESGDLLDTPLWGPPATTSPGPTARAILHAAGLLTSAMVGSSPVLVTPLPDLGGAVLRAAQFAASGVGITLVDTEDADLTLSLVSQTVTGGVRTGVRLRGWVAIEASEVSVTMRFGDAAWLDDQNGGVTVWLIEPATGGPLPVRPTAALDLIGFGADFGRSDGPLIDGTLVLGSVGGLVFARIDFFDAANLPQVTADGLGAGLSVTDAFVDVAGEDADSFLRKVMPAELTAPFDLTVVYRDGALEVHGSTPSSAGRYELSLPLDLDLTVIRITEIMLALQTGEAPALEAALSGTASIGPIAAFVKRVGVIAVFGGPRSGLRLRYPDGVGLSIDTSQLRLGGFVLVDEARGRYIGAVEISLLGKFELSAIAIITTRMPDGSEGFSLLFLISIIFPTPIALGYGFFFAGAGGLLGLNRSVDLDRLRSGLRAGTADSILFPTDIVRRADAIVRDLEESFPVAKGQFLIGPMAMIIWSTPPLVTIKLGIILELGSPIRIAILGTLRASLPDAEDPVLDLKVAFLGTIDVGAKLLTFDAAIYDSFLGRGDLKLSFEGDIAVRLSWSDQPDFVTAVGGFHPRYTPAPQLKLPAMRRIRLSLLKDNPRLTLSTYFAITSNSVQLGARLEFYLGVEGFSVEGDFGFDVLFQFSPFLFDAAVWARLAVMAGGSTLLSVNLEFSLVGPTPWIAKGTASFKVLFFTIKANFEKRFGEEALDSAPQVQLLPVLTTELGRPENWQGVLPAWSTSAIVLRDITPAQGEVVLDAGGILTISQRVLPFDTGITRFGTSHPADAARFDVPRLWLGTPPADVAAPGPDDVELVTEAVTDAFSPAAFQEMSDVDKLRAPAFERRPSGVRVATGSALRATYTRLRPARYDVIVCDSADPADEIRTPAAAVPAGAQMSAARFATLARGGAAGRSPAARERRSAAEPQVVAATAVTDLFAVIRLGDLRPLTASGSPVAADGTGTDGTPLWPGGTLLQASDAQLRLDALTRVGTADAGSLRVVPAPQLVEAGS